MTLLAWHEVSMITIAHYLQYVALSMLTGVLALLPLPLAIRFGKGLGRIFYIFDKRHREVTKQNIRASLGTGLRQADLDRIAISCFENLGLSLTEMVRAEKMTAPELMKNITIEGMENYQAAIRQGKGVVLIGAHFGSWELLGIIISIILKRVYAVARKLDNPFIERKLGRIRSSKGNLTLNKNDAFWEMIRLLKNGEIVAVLMDQNVTRREGVFVPFFGQPACTNKGLAMILLKTGTPAVPVFMVRRPDGTHRVEIKPAISLVHTGNLKSDIRENTAQI
ncbi:MAG TPA: lysophospholipid acyltransferase family protein, partial [Nitrospiria bacterium]|nr:lysophospholipid acyltransferase family protein [Nitrospiria bacterium]